MTRLLTLLQDNPKIGIGGTLGSFFTGTAAGAADQISMSHILEYLQAGAFIATIFVAVVTVWAQCLKIKKLRNGGK